MVYLSICMEIIVWIIKKQIKNRWTEGIAEYGGSRIQLRIWGLPWCPYTIVNLQGILYH